MPFCHSALKSSLAQDLSSQISRYNNLQAALKTWLDHVNRLANLQHAFQAKSQELTVLIGNFIEQVDEITPPTTFTELKDQMRGLKVSPFEFDCDCESYLPKYETSDRVNIYGKEGTFVTKVMHLPNWCGTERIADRSFMLHATTTRVNPFQS
jgi:hypothetical protein